MSNRRTLPAWWLAGACLAAAAGAPAVRAQEVATGLAEKPIVEVRLLAPEPAAAGAWLVQVEEVLNGSLPGTVVAVTDLPPALARLGEAGERLRLVLASGAGGAYRVLSGHLSPEVDPAVSSPLPPPLLPPPGRTAPGPGDGSLAPRAAPTPTPEQQVVELVNEERWSYNDGQLPPLKQVAELDASSETHSANMAARNFFSHCDLDTLTSPWDRMVAAGYIWSNAAENLTAGWSTAAGAVAAWMGSSLHRQNILSTGLREIGVGYYFQSGDQGDVRNNLTPDCTADSVGNGPYFHYWTQNFGIRSTVYPVVIEREAHSTTSATVDLYVYGTGWAQDMRFSNDGSAWSLWETYDPNKTWTLSAGGGTKTVHAQIRNGGTIRQASDTIYLDSPCAAATHLVVPDQTVTGPATFEACDTITATSGFTVGASGDAVFRAGNRIVLGDGFVVLTGGSFAAVIETP